MCKIAGIDKEHVMQTTPHEGRNIKRIREMLGIKQETLAIDLGLSQQAISNLEQRETLDVPTLEKVAKTLGVTTEAIKNFNEEAAINIIATTFNSHDNSTSVAYQSSFTFNPIDKIVELYEALLKAEREKFELLERYTKTN
jgi:transcriptional regulator with XRE-family HTH domain